MWVATQAPHEHRAFCARLLGMPEHRVRAIARDTGGGFGQKIFVLREEMAVMLAATKVPAALKWIEDRRENLMAAGWSRHESADLTMGFDDDGVIQGVHIDFVSDAGAYPTPWPAMPAMSVGMIFPGPYRVPAAGYRLRSVYTNTAGRSGYRGPWQYETLAREVVLDIAARRMGIDPVELRRRNLLRLDEMPYKNANGMRYDNVSPLETFEQAVAILGYEAFRAEQARALDGRPLPRCRLLELRRADHAGVRHLLDRGGDDPHRTDRQGERLRRRRLVGQQPRDGRGAAHGRRTRRGHRGREHDPGRHGTHRLRRRHRRQPQRRDARRRDRRDRRRAAAADRGHRRPPLRGRRGRHRALAELGARARDAGDDDVPRRDRQPRLLLPRRAARRRPARAGGQQPVQPQGPVELGQRHPRLHLRGRRSHRAGEAPALHRQRGLRADDQPERGRGPDRRRHGAGHRRSTARGHGLRRGRQPPGDHVRRLPAPDIDRGPRHRVRPPRDAGTDARRLQGRRRGRRDRRPAGGRERGQRRAGRRSASPSPACR